MKKVLFFFPHNPFPPKTGAHKRCVELLHGLKTLGCDVLLASSSFTSDTIWTEACISRTAEEFGCTVSVHSPGKLESVLSRCGNRVKRRILPNHALMRTSSSPSMKAWFSGLARDFKPDILFLNYAFFDCIVDRKAVDVRTSIIEMHDLVTLNKKMQATLINAVGMKNFVKGVLPAMTLDLNFFRQSELTADPVEYLIYDRYDVTLCISDGERALVQANAPNTRAVHLPMTQLVSRCKNTYDGDALFSVGPNPFNTQGYYCFLDRVLPLVRAKAPDFMLQVTGNFFFNATPRVVEGVRYSGFVDDLSGEYHSACFFVCPVFGGTGQQVKIVEAMANGLPVVAFEQAAQRSPLRHGENGFIAGNAEEFAHYVSLLWGDRTLCGRLGEQARNTVASGCSREQLIAGLAPLLEQSR